MFQNEIKTTTIANTKIDNNNSEYKNREDVQNKL